MIKVYSNALVSEILQINMALIIIIIILITNKATPVNLFTFSLLTTSMKIEQTEYSETSAHKIQAPGNHPKRKNPAFRTQQ
jgi:hypothetical protein